MAKPSLPLDVVIFGGGIAGLWLLAELRANGYAAVLLETNALGTGQTIASQGIIHGGTKYTLDMNVSAASKALREMPAVWRAALAGSAGPDLRAARVTASQHHMWVPRQFAGSLMSFFATRAMRGHVDALKENRPAPFDNTAFAGELLALDEIVLDVPSVLTALTAPQLSAIAAVNWPDEVLLERQNSGPWQIDLGPLALQANTIVSTAGSGNSAIAAEIGIDTKIAQYRPLQMVLIKGAPVDLHAHCIVKHKNPRLTVTSHRAQDGERVWYVGGQIAEEGVGVPADELIASAKHEIASLLPWLDFSDTAWATHDVDRAEAWQAEGRRPDHPVITKQNDVIFAWPTKFALSPQLSRQVMAELPPPTVGAAADLTALQDLPKPGIAKPPWDEAKRWS